MLYLIADAWTPAAVMELIGAITPIILAVIAYLKASQAHQTGQDALVKVGTAQVTADSAHAVATDAKASATTAITNAAVAQTTADASTSHANVLSDRLHEMAVAAPAIVQDISPIIQAVERVASDVQALKGGATLPASVKTNGADQPMKPLT